MRIVFLSVWLGACAAGPKAPARGTATIGQKDLALLTLPPGASTRRVLKRLRQASDAGDCRLAAHHLRYLVDLLDYVRLVELPGLRDESVGHALLWRALSLGNEPSRGRSATRNVLRALEARIAQGKKRCAEPIFSDAEALLAADRNDRRSASARLSTALAYKRVVLAPVNPAARNELRLRQNAQLRLIDWCYQAFRLAAGGEPSKQQSRINLCLYPLFEADAAPYFLPKAQGRPPDPPWSFLRDTLLNQLGELKAGRLSPLVVPWLRSMKTFFSVVAAELPSTIRYGRFTLPRLSGQQSRATVRVWDRHPVVAVDRNGFAVDNIAVIDGDDRGLDRALNRRLYNDSRGKITLVGRPGLKADRLFPLAKAFRYAGISTVYLAVLQQVAATAPAGDVHARLAVQGPIMRLAGVPLSLALFFSRRSLRRRGNIRGLDYAPGENLGRLQIGVTENTLSLETPVATMLVDEADFVDRICALRKAFPREQGLIFAVDDDTPLSRMTKIALLAGDAIHRCGFLSLALARRSAGEGDTPLRDLSPLLALLGGVKVQGVVRPAQLDPNSVTLPLESLETCYRRALLNFTMRGSPKAKPPQGRLVLSRRGLWRIQRTTVRDPTFRKCVANVVRAVNDSRRLPGKTELRSESQLTWTVEFSAPSVKVPATSTVGKD